jgi:RHS repeat-associated protein
LKLKRKKMKRERVKAVGALMPDYNKQICMMRYNYITLPKSVQFRYGHRIEYVYDASGVKRRTRHREANHNLNYNPWDIAEPAENDFLLTTTTDYVSNKVYKNGQLKLILTEEGYIEKNGNAYTHHYYLKDHLGNNRIVMDASGTVEQVNNYYPSGTSMAELPRRTDQGVQPYKYNNKELDRSNGLDFYDYEARMYEPTLMRFTMIDPMAEKYYAISPYAYCLNNPVRFVDPDGKEIKLAGTAAERQNILTHMQRLTNDKLGMRTDGTVIIVRMGGENSGKALTSGSELIRDLNKKGDGAKTVTISVGSGGNSAGPTNPTNASNGVGSDETVTFDPTSNPSILTKDPTTGNVSGATRPNEIGLGHELIHADRAMKGKRIDRSNTGTHTYKDAAGNTVTQTKPKEELETVGLQGNHKYNENKLRKEQGLNERGAY